MKNTLTESDFLHEVAQWDDRKDQFSKEGWRALFRALFRYIEQYEEETGKEIEMDIVAFCCEFTEYDSALDAMKEYQSEDMPAEGEEGDDLEEIAEKNEKAAREWLEDRTAVIDVEGGGVIIGEF